MKPELPSAPTRTSAPKHKLAKQLSTSLSDVAVAAASKNYEYAVPPRPLLSALPSNTFHPPSRRKAAAATSEPRRIGSTRVSQILAASLPSPDPRVSAPRTPPLHSCLAILSSSQAAPNRRDDNDDRRRQTRPCASRRSPVLLQLCTGKRRRGTISTSYLIPRRSAASPLSAQGPPPRSLFHKYAHPRIAHPPEPLGPLRGSALGGLCHPRYESCLAAAPYPSAGTYDPQPPAHLSATSRTFRCLLPLPFPCCAERRRHPLHLDSCRLYADLCHVLQTATDMICLASQCSTPAVLAA